jgi:hypothetical protein
VTKKKVGSRAKPDDGAAIQDLYDHIRLQFIANAAVIAKNEKPERLLKMIQNCKELEPVDRSNKELWKLIQKVRHDVLASKMKSQRKAEPKQRRKVPS